MKKIIAGLALMLAATFGATAQDYSNQKMQLGQKAPELEFPNPAGETLKLSEIAKGRYVLIDFWASWCGPCRRASPELVAMYDKYKDAKFEGAKNGFTVLSVSLDANKDAWMAAITADKLDWPYHMSDLGAWQSKGAKLYGVEFIPQAFLIDPNGKIVGKYAGGAKPEADIEKYLKKKG